MVFSFQLLFRTIFHYVWIRHRTIFYGSRYTPPKNYALPSRFSAATLFRFVACFACVRIENSSRNRFASTAYFAKPGTFPGEFSGGGNIPVTFFTTYTDYKVKVFNSPLQDDISYVCSGVDRGGA